jgi:hypothetical protein
MMTGVNASYRGGAHERRIKKPHTLHPVAGIQSHTRQDSPSSSSPPAPWWSIGAFHHTHTQHHHTPLLERQRRGPWSIWRAMIDQNETKKERKNEWEMNEEKHIFAIVDPWLSSPWSISRHHPASLTPKKHIVITAAMVAGPHTLVVHSVPCIQSVIIGAMVSRSHNKPNRACHGRKSHVASPSIGIQQIQKTWWDKKTKN